MCKGGYEPDYSRDTDKCKDVDECEKGNVCHQTAICENLDGGKSLQPSHVTIKLYVE